MKVKTKLCKLSAMVMEEIAELPDDLEIGDMPQICQEDMKDIEEKYKTLSLNIALMKGVLNARYN